MPDLTVSEAAAIVEAHFKTALEGYSSKFYPASLAANLGQRRKVQDLVDKLLEEPDKWRDILKKSDERIAHLVKLYGDYMETFKGNAEALENAKRIYDPPSETELLQGLDPEYVALLKGEVFVKPVQKKSYVQFFSGLLVGGAAVAAYLMIGTPKEIPVPPPVIAKVAPKPLEATVEMLANGEKVSGSVVSVEGRSVVSYKNSKGHVSIKVNTIPTDINVELFLNTKKVSSPVFVEGRNGISYQILDRQVIIYVNPFVEKPKKKVVAEKPKKKKK